jgi:small subunit ribosomal protein S17
MENAVKKSNRRLLAGLVTSGRMDKTITVQVTRTVRHPKYNKFVKKHACYHAHDENNQCRQGDFVSIVEAAPISKLKRWRLMEVLEKAAE